MTDKPRSDEGNEDLVDRYLPPRNTPGERVIFNLLVAAVWLFLWLLIVSIWQGGWSKLGELSKYSIAVFFVLGIVAVLRESFTKYPLMIIAFVLTVWGAFALYSTGSVRTSSQFLWDLLGVGVGLLLYLGVEMQGILFRMGTGREFRMNRFSPGQRWLMMVLACWIGISVATAWRPALESPKVERFASISAPEMPYWKEARVGLALSGGGYRAAVFHTGTLHALESLGITVDNLSTVSGGSIIGAYYANGGDPIEFKDAVANGRFNLKRELLLMHNTVRLICPMRVPIIDVELLPACHFSRRDVQASMLDRLMFDNKEHEEASTPLAPSLVINTTDLTYGQLVGFLPDGLVIQAPNLDVHVYRGDAYRPEQMFTLSERVALSGAFPIAFPPGEFNVKVYPQTGSGHGTRQLWLADGGIADNSGIHSLIGAHRFACEGTNCIHGHTLPASWRSDLMLISDGGAIFGVESELNTPAQLSRAVDIGGARTGKRLDRLRSVPTVALSAQLSFLDPGMQFRAYKDPNDRRPGNENMNKTVQFRPGQDYPNDVLDRLFALLPPERHPDVGAAWQRYKAVRSGNAAVDPRLWSTHMAYRNKEEVDSCPERRKSGASAQTLQSLPGICDALLLKYSVRTEIRYLLDAFRDTSTLDDQFGAERAEELFRLGQMLVYVKWHLIDRAFQEVDAQRSSS